LRTEGRLLGRDLSLPAVGRDRKIGVIELAQGDRIRFGENLPQFRIRNGTRATIEHIRSDVSAVHLAVRLDDGRLIEAPWASLVREQPGRLPLPPCIVSAYAGTAYSVQGRTSAAAVLYIAKPTDARETYVGLTRHRIDACVVAERGRLEAAVQRRQADARAIPSDILIREKLFTEARTYVEKANVADYVEDQIDFMRTGQIQLPRDRDTGGLNFGRVARAAQRIFKAARETASEHSLSMPAWRMVESVRHMPRQATQRVAALVRVISARIEHRRRERAVAQDRDLGR
jgi:hypothetical protein